MNRALLEDKICRTCLILKPRSDYYIRSSIKTEDLRIRADCKVCSRARYHSSDEQKERSKQYARTSNANSKAKVIAAYGGKCVCCGESEPGFLTIDHINGNGADMRRSGEGQGSVLYLSLRKRGFPKDNYQLLCFNCNCGKRLTGVCPHHKIKK